MKVIHVQWNGPYSLEQVSTLSNKSHDYGVYQVYGSHPIYGSDVLLYIGKASQQTFATRLKQEPWLYNQDAGNIKFYVGRLAAKQTPAEPEWDQQISLVEALLVHSHWPARNSQYVQSLGSNAAQLSNIHILNWGQRRDLLGEVSGLMLTDVYYVIPNYHCYGDENNSLKV